MNKTKILLVDDDEIIRESLSRLLERKGYIVDPKSSGPEAIKALNKSHYHVLLTDLNMPEMNGIELLKVVEKIAPDMIKIIMTGYGDIKTYLDAMAIGVTEYINKPVQFSELDTIIRQFMKNKSSLKKANFTEGVSEV